MPQRTWDFWTEQKLEILADYLPGFTRASQKAGTTIYLDLFAGDVSNISRVSGDPISGSPTVALDTAPPLSKVVLFELPGRAERLRADLRAQYPTRDVTVHPGDCNETIDAALAQLADYSWAPTFALVDQYAAEVRWETLAKIAGFKRPGRRHTKAELWLLFAHSMLPRGLGGDNLDQVTRFADRITAMYGDEAWLEPLKGRQSGLLSARQLREELANLMRWRLETVLGYRITHTFEMHNTQRGPLYSMIFASDHEVGGKIMASIYGKAAQRQPKMRAQALQIRKERREKQEGTLTLFPPPTPHVADADLYQHLPPWQPFRFPAADD